MLWQKKTLRWGIYVDGKRLIKWNTCLCSQSFHIKTSVYRKHRVMKGYSVRKYVCHLFFLPVILLVTFLLLTLKNEKAYLTLAWKRLLMQKKLILQRCCVGFPLAAFKPFEGDCPGVAPASLLFAVSCESHPPTHLLPSAFSWDTLYGHLCAAISFGM